MSFKKVIKLFKDRKILELGVPFGLGMGLFYFFTTYDSLTAFMTGILSGAFYGFLMATFFNGAKKGGESESSEKLIILKYSKWFSLFMLFGSGLFLSLLLMVNILSFFSLADSILYSLFSFSLFLISLWSVRDFQKIIVIGDNFIHEELEIGSYGYKETRYFNEIKEMKFSWSSLRIFFNDGFKIDVSLLYADRFRFLPEYTGKVKNKNFEPMHRLKVEIDRRKRENPAGDQREIEKVLMGVEKPQKIGVKSYISFAFGLLLLAVPLAGDVSFHRSKISSAENLQSLRQSDIESAFDIFKGKLYGKLKTDWETNCSENNDYFCRLASYFYAIEGNHEKSLELVKLSCGEGDPHSCYNILSNDLSNKEDQERAIRFLDGYCTSKASEEKACCSCYESLKSKRSLATE